MTISGETGVLLEPLTKYSERRTGGPPCYQPTLCTVIGPELRSYYDLSEPIPNRMLKLLEQLDDAVKPDDSTGAHAGDTFDPELRQSLDVQSPDAHQLLLGKGSEPASTTTSEIYFGPFRLLPA
jgi:hypothetical protein